MPSVTLPSRGRGGQVAGPARFIRFLAKATITQQAAICRGTIGDLSKPAKMKARCRWRRKLGAADFGKEPAAEEANPVGYLSGDTGIGLATFSYKLSMTRCLQTGGGSRLVA